MSFNLQASKRLLLFLSDIFYHSYHTGWFNFSNEFILGVKKSAVKMEVDGVDRRRPDNVKLVNVKHFAGSIY